MSRSHDLTSSGHRRQLFTGLNLCGKTVSCKLFLELEIFLSCYTM